MKLEHDSTQHLNTDWTSIESWFSALQANFKNLWYNKLYTLKLSNQMNNTSMWYTEKWPNLMQNGIARDFKIKTISLPGEAEQLNHRMQETIFQSTDNIEEPVSCDWADKVSNISCTPSPPTLQEITIQKN